MPKEWESAQYDEVYASGGADRIYDLPYRHSGYFPLFDEVARSLRASGVNSVLEIGCGTGGFAHLLLDRNAAIAYRGFDFSPVAVERAKTRTQRPDLFFVGDARRHQTYAGEFDAIVCTEVLEHIEDDLEVVANWKRGVYCVCSVPNFEADNHVRVFSAKEEVLKRYGQQIDIESIVQVKRPFLYDLSWRSYARELRWNRYRPRRIVQILGLESFERAGGWYVFSGRRKPS